MKQRARGSTDDPNTVAPKCTGKNSVISFHSSIHTIDEIYDEVTKMSSLIHSGAASTNTEVEAAASRDVMEQLMRTYMFSEKIYAKYDTSKGGIKYLANMKMQKKKSEQRKVAAKKHTCLRQRRVQTCKRRRSVLEAKYAYFKQKFGEDVDSIFHADYMSDLESDIGDEGAEGPSQQKFFWRFRPTWRSKGITKRLNISLSDGRYFATAIEGSSHNSSTASIND
ncbi:hypothetical protein CLU79DRAFT_834376 [Phycomyces nitens]|nr:hypothetical protein CLU79DRAFT_834376 [Phycomyces nitens]